MKIKYTIILLALILISCNASINNKDKTSLKNSTTVTTTTPTTTQVAITKATTQQAAPAIEQIEEWIPLLKNKSIAVVGNQTSVIESHKQIIKNTWDQTPTKTYTHLVDTLLSRGVKVKKVFAPEHGFRGTADAGAHIENGIDTTTGLPIISLYGKNKQPTATQLADVDLILFDIQDVGARFYTYISTLHYIMKACAIHNKQLIVLDRPNPNGHYVDGPVLEPAHKSFVGMHPIPIVHGMTIGEYASMILGENWLGKGITCDLRVIKMNQYNHHTVYSLPIPPSPNLPNDQSINLYPSLCLFEGTNVSVGRGTTMQFQVYGAPDLVKYQGFSFTPTPHPGAKRPLHNGKKCYGLDLRKQHKLDRIELEYIIDAFAKAPSKRNFFNSFFTKLAGTKKLQQQIEAGKTAQEIRSGWQNDLDKFKKTRDKYLLYL